MHHKGTDQRQRDRARERRERARGRGRKERGKIEAMSLIEGEVTDQSAAIAREETGKNY